MLTILLPLLVLSSDVKFPKYSFLYVGPSLSEEEAKEETKYYKENIEGQCREEVEEDPTSDYDFCIAYHKAFQEIRYSKGSDINDQLKKFSKVNEVIVIVGSNMAEIDLNNLKAQMKVVFEYDYEVDYQGKIQQKTKQYIKRMMKSSFDGSDESIIRLLKQKNRKTPKYNSEEPILFKGGIKDKVSFFAVDEGYIKFTQKDLDCHSFGLFDTLHEDSKNIRTTFLITSQNTHEKIYDYLGSDMIKIDQYSVYIWDYESKNTYEITYYDDHWFVSYSDRSFSIPYSAAPKFNLISNSSHFVVKRASGVHLNSFPPINITTVYIYAWTELAAKQLSQSITLEAQGWDDIDKEKRPKVTLTYDPKYFEYKKDENSELDVSPEVKYSYKPLNRKNVNVGLIVGVTVACVVVVVVIIVVVVIVVRKKKGVGNSSNDQD